MARVQVSFRVLKECGGHEAAVLVLRKNWLLDVVSRHARIRTPESK